MQRASPGRGFNVSHQKVALELGFAGTICGYTEITIVPTTRSLRTVHLNSRQAVIQHISCAGRPADYSYNDHLSSLSLSDPKDVHLYPELKRKLYAAASEGSGGELSILLPPDINVELQGAGGTSAADHARSGSAVSDAPTPGGSAIDYAPITIKIEYLVRDPVDGLQFVRPTAEAPYRVPHLYTSPTCADAARCWVPCVDSLWERCTWELEFVVPKHLSAEEEDEDVVEGETSLEGGMEDSEVIVVCSGDLMEQVAHPHNSTKTIFYYSQAVAISVQQIGFAAGPFLMQSLTAQSRNTVPSTAPAIEETGQPQMFAFCLPGREAEMHNSVAFTRQAMDFYGREFGSYPFSSYKMVFVDEPIVDSHSTSTLTVCSADLLHPRNVIDQAMETRQVLSHAIAFQWVGINIIQKTWSDTWLINGLSLYITGLFLRKLMGNNEYRFRLKKDCDRLCAWDIGMPPVYQVGMTEPPDATLLPFINLKAPLVLHILDRRLCKVGASLGLGRVIPKVFLQAITGEMSNNALSTHSFLRTCRKVSGVDLKSFADQWIYASGCPKLICTAHFNRKKLLIEMHVRQESPAAQFAAARPEEAINSNPVKLFEGQMTVRIHEADGTPYEHVLDIKGPAKRYEVPFNTKYKRVRRNTKRFQARQAAAAAAAEGDQDAVEAIGMIDLGFGLGLWEDEQERERWKVADWTEEDEAMMASAPYEWIRLDADFEWIAQIYFDQPDYMWISQLQRDRDVVAQLAAVHAISLLPSPITSSMLTRTALVTKYFYRVRTEAVQALVQCATPQLDYLGFFHLLLLFRTRFCYEPPREADASNPFEMVCIPRANDFSDFSEYFLQRALVHAISRVRNERGRTLPHVKRFLINLLRYNDNSTNKFVDDFYIAGVVIALAGAFVPADSAMYGGFVPAHEDPDARDDETLLQRACEEVDRYQELDKLVPSFQNVVTLASIDWHMTMMLANLRSVDLQLFLGYTREGNYTPVRIAALNALLLLRGLQHKVLTRYFFALLRSDASRSVRRALARTMCEALAIALSTGEFGAANTRGPEAMLVEEGNSSRTEAGAREREGQFEAMFKGLKREVGRSAAVREGFLAALLAPNVDSEARWGLLKLAELLFKPAEEKDLPFLPKVQVRVRMPSMSQAPSTPVSAAAEGPSHTKIKLVKPSADAELQAIPEGASQPAQTQRVVAFNAPEKEARGPGAKPAKPKKIKPLPPAQASGMTSADLTACRNCLKKLLDSKHAPLFLNPVDPVRDKAPNYFNIINNPMDLSTLGNKLNSGMYADRFAFKTDFELIIANAKRYTPDPKAWVHTEAIALEHVFNQQWNRITKTLEQAAAKQAKAAQGATSESTVQQSDERSPPTVQPNGHAAPPSVAMPPPPASISLTKKQPSVEAPATPVTPKPGGTSVKLKLKPPKLVGTPKASVESPAPPPSTPKPPPTTPKPPPTTSKLPPSTPKPPPATPKRSKQTSASPRKEAEHERPPKKKATVPASSVDDELLAMIGDSEANGHAAKPAMSPSSGEGLLQRSSPLVSVKKSKAAAASPATTSLAGRSEFPASPSPAPSKATPPASKTKKPSAESDPIGASLGEPINVKRCKNLLQTVKKLPEAIFFLRPVDPILDGAPTYLDEIKHPMDLGTMEKKLERGEYSTMDEFASDMQLIFANCRQFNPPMTIPCQHADIMERAWRKEWARALVRRLEYTEKRALSGMLSRLRAHPTSGLFLTAVDPVALGIPTYFDIIPRKDARDLSLINEKLKNDQYNSIEALDADVRLMLKNCYTFNQADEVVCGLAKNFEGVYEKEMRAVRASLTGPNASTSVGKAGGGGAGNKRPNKEMSGASSNKKSKLG